MYSDSIFLYDLKDLNACIEVTNTLRICLVYGITPIHKFSTKVIEILDAFQPMKLAQD